MLLSVSLGLREMMDFPKAAPRWSQRDLVHCDPKVGTYLVFAED